MAEPDLAHFRARVRVLDTEKGAMEAGLVVGAGLAELQVGQDAPGFVVGDDSPTEGAGPEVSVGVKGRVWLHPQVYLVGDITAGSAWMVAAPRLLDQESGFVPFGAITVGAGF